METFFLLACNLPGNAVKTLTDIKQSIFTRTGLVSARVLPSFLPLSWFSTPPEKRDFSEPGSLLPEEKRETDAFFTEPPLLKDSIYWLPVKPLLRITPPIKSDAAGLFPLFFGIPLAYAKEKDAEIPLRVIQKECDEIKLRWKGMTFSCYSLTALSPRGEGKPFVEYGIVYEELWRGKVIPGATRPC